MVIDCLLCLTTTLVQVTSGTAGNCSGTPRIKITIYNQNTSCLTIGKGIFKKHHIISKLASYVTLCPYPEAF